MYLILGGCGAVVRPAGVVTGIVAFSGAASLGVAWVAIRVMAPDASKGDDFPALGMRN